MKRNRVISLTETTVKNELDRIKRDSQVRLDRTLWCYLDNLFDSRIRTRLWIMLGWPMLSDCRNYEEGE